MLSKRNEDPEACGPVRARLVAKLYQIKPQVCAGSAAGILLLGGAAGFRSGDTATLLLACIAAMFALALGLLLIFKPLPTGSSWALCAAAERRFALLAIGSSAGVGATCARALSGPDSLSHLMAITLSIAAMTMVMRNYFRSWIVTCQLVAIFFPTAVALIAHGKIEYTVVEAAGMVLFYTLYQVVAGLNREAVASITKDITVNEQNVRFDAAINNIEQGLAMFGSDGRLLVYNERWKELYGFDSSSVAPGMHLRELIAQCEQLGHSLGTIEREAVEDSSEGKPSTHFNELSGGRTVFVTFKGMAGGGWVATHEDITERLEAEQRIRYLALHDSLTELPNRFSLHQGLEELLRSRGREQCLAVLCIDLDRFKAVNDTLGHAIGDKLLQEVAVRLRASCRTGDLVARLGGDEFAVVQVSGAEPLATTFLADRIVQQLSEPYEIEGHRINIGATIGVSMAPTDSDQVDQLLKNADIALYRAKAEGRGQHRFYAAEMDARMQARRVLELDLRAALANGEFELAYQPLMCVETGAISAFEALLRWNHPARGKVLPGEFIGLAEEIGLIVPIGEWVLREACRTAATWPEHVRISVNLSPAQFRSGSIIKTVSKAIAEAGLAPRRLELEITEGLLLTENEAAMRELGHLQSLGIGVAMDDFGTGYSSLSYLQSFPFDRIKIDQSFVQGIGNGGEALAILRAIVSLGRSLGIATTAEGVETREQFDRLTAEGCTEAQGYLLGRPMSDRAAFRMLAREADTLSSKAA